MASSRKSASKGGRPAKGPFQNKSRTLSTRITKETREQLEKGAKKSGRSLSQEIEFRLDQSFRREKAAKDIRQIVLDDIHDRFGGRNNFNVMTTLSTLIIVIEERIGKTWLEDRETYQNVQYAIRGFLESLAPKLSKGRSGLHGGFSPHHGEAALNDLHQFMKDKAAKRREK